MNPGNWQYGNMFCSQCFSLQLLYDAPLPYCIAHDVEGLDAEAAMHGLRVDEGVRNAEGVPHEEDRYLISKTTLLLASTLILLCKQ